MFLLPFVSLSVLFIVTASSQSNLTKSPIEEATTITNLSAIKNLTETQVILSEDKGNLKDTNKNVTTLKEVLSEPEIAERKSPGSVLQSSNPRSKALGEKCTSKQDCREENAVCTYGLCTCMTDFIKSSNGRNCFKIVHQMGDPCSEDHQCNEGLNKTYGKTICMGFKCTCAVNHRLMGGKCVGEKVLSTVCWSDADCGIARSKCKESICICEDNLIPHPNDTSCLPAAKKLNDSCEEDLQCHEIKNTKCRDGKCVCDPLHHYDSENCIPIKALGDDCEKNFDCEVDEEPGMRGCLNGKCSCIKGVRNDDICRSGARSIAASLGFLLLSLKISFL